ncbi:MAG: hypothetical protein RLZZ37_1104 [Actinomycetota bacterium]|jgi:hypothetical protein
MKIIPLHQNFDSNLLLRIKPEAIYNNKWIQDELNFGEFDSVIPLPIDTLISNGLPEPKAWTKQLVTGIAEVLIGERPIFQLMRWVSFDVYLEIDKNIKQRNNKNSQRIRPLIRSVHIDQTSENVVQAIAVIQKGKRGRGMGIRLEAEEDRWRCTELLVA